MVVHNESLPRGLWKLGRIQEIITGRDGKIRGAIVKVASQNRQHPLLRRPIQVLYPLEVHSQEKAPAATVSDDCEPETQSQENSVPTEPPQSPPEQEPRRCSQRSAATRANDRRKACMLELENC